MIARLLIAVIVIGAVIVFVRGMRARGPARRPAISARTARCAHCQVYFPRREAVEVAGRSYCSREHAEQGRA
ncbi:MAG: PP0621 family protein [Gammaproteobacteria bacterium]